MMSDQSWWRCPVDPPCPHPGVVHDIEDLEDRRPRCGVEGCWCGSSPPEPPQELVDRLAALEAEVREVERARSVVPPVYPVGVFLRLDERERGQLGGGSSDDG
jgi:hypothetical protein